MTAIVTRRERARLLRRALRPVVRQVSRLVRRLEQHTLPLESAVVTLAPQGPRLGRALLSHQIHAFIPELRARHLGTHNQYDEAVAMAETLVEMGFEVDLVSARRRRPVRGRAYELMIAHRVNLADLAAGLPETCLRIAYLDMTHWSFNSRASLGRTLSAQAQRGGTPGPPRLIGPNKAIEQAHCGILMGHEHAHATYAFAGKPIFEIVNLATTRHPAPRDKDFAACRQRFLWLGGQGLAHKGLGLTLEAFAGMPEMHLTVCGPIADEPAFCRLYRAELEGCPNIEVLGWIDPAGPAFTNLARGTLALVFPSCAEAQSGGVLNCMQAGLIPVVSRATNVRTAPDFGIELADDSVEAIRAAVRDLASRPPERLADMALRTWQVTEGRHSRAAFKRTLRSVLERILAAHPALPKAGFHPLPAPGGDSGA